MSDAAGKCDCELRNRAWNPNTGRCGTCGCSIPPVAPTLVGNVPGHDGAIFGPLVLGTRSLIGCSCGYRCTTQNPDEELARHVAEMRIARTTMAEPSRAVAADAGADGCTCDNPNHGQCEFCTRARPPRSRAESVPTRTRPTIVRIHRAERTAQIDVPELSIFAIDPVPRFAESGNFGAWHEQARGFYAIQAATLADGLFASLPGGTIDALLVEMLKRKAGVLCIPMVEPTSPDPLRIEAARIHKELSALVKLSAWVNHAFGANAADRIIEGESPKVVSLDDLQAMRREADSRPHPDQRLEAYEAGLARLGVKS